MKRRLLLATYLIALAVLGAAWVRSAWLMPYRNYAFDFSINYTGARLLHRDGNDANLYDRAALAEEARPYTAYESLYSKLFLTYIQTPLTAVVLLPLADVTYDDARLTMLAASNLMLVASVAIMLFALRPSKLLVFAAALIFGTYEAMFDSLRLGNMDGPIVLTLALAFLALRRGPRWLVGPPLALAAMLKMSPAIVLGYFVWRRDWRITIAAVVTGVLILGGSLAVAGFENHRTFVEDTAPKLSKGSTFYDNISIAGAVARYHLGDWSWYHEDEVPDLPLGLRALMLALTATLVVGAWVCARADEEAGFMLCTLVAVLVGPVSWSFYPTWLIPSLLFLVYRYEQRRAWGRLAILALLYPLLAIVPAHFSELSDDIYRYPIKTAVLCLYGLLLLWEALGAGSRQAVRQTGRRRGAATVGARS